MRGYRCRNLHLGLKGSIATVDTIPVLKSNVKILDSRIASCCLMYEDYSIGGIRQWKKHQNEHACDIIHNEWSH